MQMIAIQVYYKSRDLMSIEILDSTILNVTLFKSSGSPKFDVH
jgi:hypothetical protein